MSDTTHEYHHDVNEPLDENSIPINTNLIFIDLLNQLLNLRSIPLSVTHLTFGFYFDQWLNLGSIPIRLPI